MTLGVALIQFGVSVAELGIQIAIQPFRKPHSVATVRQPVIYVPPVQACAYCGTHHLPSRNNCENCGASYQ